MAFNMKSIIAMSIVLLLSALILPLAISSFVNNPLTESVETDITDDLVTESLTNDDNTTFVNYTMSINTNYSYRIRIETVITGNYEIMNYSFALNQTPVTSIITGLQLNNSANYTSRLINSTITEISFSMNINATEESTLSLIVTTITSELVDESNAVVKVYALIPLLAAMVFVVAMVKTYLNKRNE